MHIYKAIKALSYQCAIYGYVNNQQDWDKNVNIIKQADENGNAIFYDIKPITYEETINKLNELIAQEEQDKIDKEARIASAKAKLEALGLTTEEIKDTFGL